MKKLMTVIAAVAMSFGLFAEPASHFISFEAADECVDQDGKLVKTGWTGDASVIDLVGGYSYSGADSRRDDDFAGADTNLKCLKLETGSNQVVCTPGGDTDDIFFDQVVKFTGYEEPPTVTGGKIAVWMSGIESDDTVTGETNLYVTCAKVNAAGEATPTNICIGAYDIDAWHRVTIKSLGDIAEGDPRAGFLVYIDGAQVGSFAGIADADALKEKFQSYSASGILFPALDDDDATVTAVAYQGIGELDDVAIDDLGPQFARFVEGTVAAINGATLALTNLTDMTEVAVDSDGKFQVAPNSSLLFTYTATEGNFLTGGKEIATATGNIGDRQEFDFNDDIVSQKKIAKYGNEIGEEFFAASIQDAIENDESGMIVLVTNAVLTASVDMAGFSGEFDLAGFTVSGTWATSYANPGAGRDYLFEIGSDAEVTVYGGTITSTGNNIGAFHVVGGSLSLDDVTVNASWRAIGAYKGATVEVGDGAVLTTSGEDPTIFIWSNFQDLENDEVQCKVTIAGQVSNTFAGPRTCANLDAVIMGNGNDKLAGVALTIEDGAEIEGAACAGIYFPCAGALSIGQASITGTEGVYVKGGASTIVDGAEITATGAAGEFLANHNGHAWTGDAFVVDVSKGYAEVAEQSITGGTFESTFGVAVASYKEDGATADRVTGFIEGGLFKGAALPATDLIAAEEGYRGKWVEDKDGFYAPSTEKIPETYAITIGTIANATLTIDGKAAANFDAVEDQEYELAVTAAEGYNTPVITFAGETIAAGKYVFTKAGTLAASATINTYTVTFSTNETAVAEKTVTGVEHGATLKAEQIPDDFGEGKWDVDPATAVITCDTNFNFTVEEPVIPVPIKPDADLDPQGVIAAEAVMAEFGTPAAIDTWAKAVYADGQIPASKLNKSTPDLIAIAKEYNIPVLTEDATVTTAQAEDGAFTFKIVDGGDVQLLAAAVEKMIKYSADLSSFAVDATQVGAEVQADKVTIKAVFKKPADETKGFMKLELTKPAL